MFNKIINLFKSLKNKIEDKKDNVTEHISNKKDNLEFIKDDIKSFPWKKALICLSFIPFILWASIYWFLSTDEIVKVTTKSSKTIDTVLIQKKSQDGTIVNISKNVDRNFVYTDSGAFIYEPSLFFLQEEVSNKYGAIEEQTYYVLTHYGVRFSFFTFIRLYENIIDYRKATTEEIRSYLKDKPLELLEFEDKMSRLNNIKKELSKN